MAKQQLLITTVINIKDAPKDWPYDSNYVYIGRSGAYSGPLKGYYGNPYSHQRGTLAEFIVKTREEAVSKYRDYFYKRMEEDETFRKNVEKLRGKMLVCFCVPLACHGNIIAEYLDWTSQR